MQDDRLTHYEAVQSKNAWKYQKRLRKTSLENRANYVKWERLRSCYQTQTQLSPTLIDGIKTK